MNDIHATFAAQGLVRPRDGRVLAGVVAGLGRRFGINPWPARLLFVLLLMVIPGSQLLIYPVLWILMPAEGPAPLPAPVPPATVAAAGQHRPDAPAAAGRLTTTSPQDGPGSATEPGPSGHSGRPSRTPGTRPWPETH